MSCDYQHIKISSLGWIILPNFFIYHFSVHYGHLNPYMTDSVLGNAKGIFIQDGQVCLFTWRDEAEQIILAGTPTGMAEI